MEQLAAVNLRRLDHADAGTPAFEDQLAEMAALRDEGKIAGIGISNVSAEQVATAIDLAGIVCVQNAYSLVDRADEATLTLCTAEGVAYVPFFPLGSAFPGLPKVVDHPATRAVAERYGVVPQQIGLAWLLAHAENILLIPGTSSVAHLEENIAVGSIRLTADELAELEA